MSEKYFITGAQGCIGSWIVKALVERGDHPVVFDRSDDSRRLSAIIDAADLAKVQFVTGDITDRAAVLELRHKIEYPVVWLAASEDGAAGTPAEPGPTIEMPQRGQRPLRCHPRFAADSERMREMISRLDAGFDLAEPFVRIREAIGEARKMGVHK